MLLTHLYSNLESANDDTVAIAPAPVRRVEWKQPSAGVTHVRQGLDRLPKQACPRSDKDDALDSAPTTSSSWLAPVEPLRMKGSRGLPRKEPCTGEQRLLNSTHKGGIRCTGGKMKNANRYVPRSMMPLTAAQTLEKNKRHPYKFLGLGLCDDDPSRIDAAYRSRLMGISDYNTGELSDDPDSHGHQELSLISEAHEVLSNPRLKRLLDKCLNQCFGKAINNAIDILDIHLQEEPLTRDKIDQAYDNRHAEWAPYANVGHVVIHMFAPARNRLLRDLLEAEEFQGRQAERERSDDARRKGMAKQWGAGEGQKEA